MMKYKSWKKTDMYYVSCGRKGLYRHRHKKHIKKLHCRHCHITAAIIKKKDFVITQGNTVRDPRTEFKGFEINKLSYQESNNKQKVI